MNRRGFVTRGSRRAPRWRCLIRICSPRARRWCKRDSVERRAISIIGLGTARRYEEVRRHGKGTRRETIVNQRNWLEMDRSSSYGRAEAVVGELVEDLEDSRIRCSWQ